MNNVDVTAPVDTGWCAKKLREYSEQGEKGKKMLKPLLKKLVKPELARNEQPYLSFTYDMAGQTREAKHANFVDFMHKWCKLSLDDVRCLFHDDTEVTDLLDWAQGDGRIHGNNPAGRNQHQSKEDNVDNIHVNQDEPERPTGTSKEATLRRLRKDYPELHGQVIAGEISPNAAAIQAGFRQRTVSIKLNPESAAQTIAKHFSNEDIKELIGRLNMAVEALSA